MEQSVTRVSGMGKIARILLVALLSLLGLSVIGVGKAYAAGPVLKSLTPATGTANGGNPIVIAGSGFGTVAGNVTVTFGGVPSLFVLTSGIKITAVPPTAPNPTAAVKVVVTVSGVPDSPLSPGVDTYTYTWSTAPVVSAVGLVAASVGAQVGTLNTISAAGTWTAGQNVSLGGFSNGLPTGIYSVVTGGTNSFTVNNAGTTTGAGTGTVSPSPAGGVGPVAGGHPVVIEGTNLGGASAVTFGGTPATTFTVNSGTQITATAPPGSAGAVDVAVTTPFSTSVATPSSDTYTYITTPTVTGTTTVVSPAGGPTGGGTSVTIAGAGFDNVTAVTFGATPAASFLVNGLNSITAVSPAGSGTVDITVTTSLGTSATSANDKFAYNGTLAVANGTASYDNSPGTTVQATGTSQSGSTVTILAPGNWTAAIKIQLSGFTNGLTAGTYPIAAQVTGGFTITFAPVLTGSSTGTVLIPQTSTPTLVKSTR